MKHLLLCLLLAAGCETKAAELAPGFARLGDLDRTSAANVAAALALLPIERLDQPRLEYTPRTLVDAERAIEAALQERIPKLSEACLTNDWMLFSPAPAEDGSRFEHGWALRRSTMQLYAFDSR